MPGPAKAQRHNIPPAVWEPSTGLCVGIMAFLTFVFFSPILLGKAYLWEDFLYAWYPYREFAAVSMAHGELPLWNPYSFNGMPFLADIQMELFYLPITALVFFVHQGHLGVYWLELVNILHYPVAGAGMFLLARSFRLHRLPSLFAGITFMFSGFMVTHAIHQVIITLVAWYPWILLLFRKTLTEKSWTWPFATALLLGHTFFAGFPQLSLFFYFFLFVFFVFELLTTYRLRELISRPALMTCLRAAAAVGLSVGITLVQLLPTMEMTREAVRAEISFTKATEGSFSWVQLITFFYPKFFGTADAAGYNYWGPGTYWYYWETCIYVGILPLLLSVLSARAFRVNKYVPFFLGFGIFSILFALGGNFVVQKFFFFYVPGFETFRNPSRMTVFVAFGAATLSGFALEELFFGQRNSAANRTLLKILLGTGGAAVLFWILLQMGTWSALFPFLQQARVAAAVNSSSGTSLVFLVLSLLALYGAIRRPSTALAVVMPALMFLDLYVFGSDQNNGTVNPETYFARAEPVVRFLKTQKGIFRVNTRNPDGMVMDRNQGMVDRVFTMEGYTPLVLQRVRPPVNDSLMFDLMNTRFKTVTDRRAGELRLVENPTALPRISLAYRVMVAGTDQQVVDSMNSPGFRHGAAVVLERDPGCTLTPPPDSAARMAQITEYGNNAIQAEVETPVRAALVFSEIYYPGWRAYIDGTETEVFRADYNLRAIIVGPGTHAVVMKFQPASFSRGAVGTIATLLVCVAGLVFARRSTRTVPPGKPTP